MELAGGRRLRDDARVGRVDGRSGRANGARLARGWRRHRRASNASRRGDGARVVRGCNDDSKVNTHYREVRIFLRARLHMEQNNGNGNTELVAVKILVFIHRHRLSYRHLRASHFLSQNGGAPIYLASQVGSRFYCLYRRS